MRKHRSLSVDEILRHAAWLRRVAAVWVGDRDLADDLAQDTLIAALKGRDDAIISDVRPWLRGILRNTYRMFCRTRARRRRYEAEVPTDGLGVTTPETMLTTRHAAHVVRRALATLDEPLRTTMLLHYYDGLSAAEIARRHRVPASTVRTRVASGLAHLRSVAPARLIEGSRP